MASKTRNEPKRKQGKLGGLRKRIPLSQCLQILGASALRYQCGGTSVGGRKGERGKGGRGEESEKENKEKKEKDPMSELEDLLSSGELESGYAKALNLPVTAIQKESDSPLEQILDQKVLKSLYADLTTSADQSDKTDNTENTEHKEK